MNKNYVKKSVSCLLAVLFTISCFPLNVFADSIDAGTESTYIIKANDENAKKLSENLNGNLTEDGIITDVQLTPIEAKSIENKKYVISVEKDIILTGDSADTTESSDDIQWNLEAMGITDVENSQYKPKVALIDSGVSYSDSITVFDSVDYVDDGNENPLFNDSNGHGTAMAGVICAADDGLGITGVNPNVALYSAKVLDNNNNSPISRVLQAIYWAIDNDVDVINMSFGTSVDSELLHSAIIAAYNAGILLVASAGNCADKSISFPAAYDEVIAVGASTSSGSIWQDTSVGDELELLAPGEKVMSAGLFAGVICTSGTSISAAEVSGVASLLIQKDAYKSPKFIRDLLSASAKTVDGYKFVDYNYADRIYDDFSANYVSNGEYENIFSNTDALIDYSDCTEAMVSGLWKYDIHESQANNAAGEAGLSTYYTGIVSYACNKVDEFYGSNASQYSNTIEKKVNAFHGRGNYVANIRFLSDFAQYMGQGLSLSKALSKCQSKFTKMIEYNNGEYKAIKDKDSRNKDDKNINYYTDDQIMADMIKAIKEIYNDLQNPNSAGRLYKYDTIGPNRRMLVFLGVVLHMIGDVYAHRTIVPKIAVSNISTSLNIKFDSSDFNTAKPAVSATSVKSGLKDYVSVTSPFLVLSGNNKDDQEMVKKYKYWDYFVASVNWQIIEFQDAIMFQTNTKRKYDDEPTFFSGRYADASRCCKAYLSAIISANFPDFTAVQEFHPKYIFPNHDLVVLNNLRGYTIDGAGLLDKDYSEADWNAHSTASLV